MACQVSSEYQDEYWNDIVFEFAMNFTVDSVRNGYTKNKKKEKDRISDDELRELGYSEEDIQNRTD